MISISHKYCKLIERSKQMTTYHDIDDFMYSPCVRMNQPYAIQERYADMRNRLLKME